MTINLPKRNNSLIPEKDNKPPVLILTRSSSLSHLSYKKPHTFLKSNSIDSLPPVPPIPEKKLIPPTRSTSLKKVNKKVEINEDIRKSLLEWKHKSISNWNDLFSPSIELWSTQDNIFGSIENIFLSKKSKTEFDEIEEIVKSLWLEDERFVTKKNTASYLGKLDPFHHKILIHYLDQFDFSNLSLDEAFRKLCSKLYFKAEAQEIDRILEGFSYKYWNTLDHSFYKSSDIIYTITYSIMLLNTDLYIFINNHTKMTCDLFCENTMSTILEQKSILNITKDKEFFEWKEQLIEHLKEIYLSVKKKGILQPIDEIELNRKTTVLKKMGSIRKKRN